MLCTSNLVIFQKFTKCPSRDYPGSTILCSNISDNIGHDIGMFDRALITIEKL